MSNFIWFKAEKNQISTPKSTDPSHHFIKAKNKKFVQLLLLWTKKKRAIVFGIPEMKTDFMLLNIMVNVTSNKTILSIQSSVKVYGGDIDVKTTQQWT